jgi:hypothetical protein
MPDHPAHKAHSGAGETSGTRSSHATETGDVPASEADDSGDVTEIPIGTPVSPDEFEALKRAARLLDEEPPDS